MRITPGLTGAAPPNSPGFVAGKLTGARLNPWLGAIIEATKVVSHRKPVALVSTSIDFVVNHGNIRTHNEFLTGVYDLVRVPARIVCVPLNILLY